MILVSKETNEQSRVQQDLKRNVKTEDFKTEKLHRMTMFGFSVKRKGDVYYCVGIFVCQSCSCISVEAWETHSLWPCVIVWFSAKCLHNPTFFRWKQKETIWKRVKSLFMCDLGLLQLHRHLVFSWLVLLFLMYSQIFTEGDSRCSDFDFFWASGLLHFSCLETQILFNVLMTWFIPTV